MAEGFICRRGGGGGNQSMIIVTAPAGSTVTATMGGKVKTSAEKAGQWIFRNCGVGEWIVEATHPDYNNTATGKVIISEEGRLLVYKTELSFWDGSFYKNGEEYNELTGGWNINKTCGGTVKKSADSIIISSRGKDGETTYFRVFTASKVDVTKFKTLCINKEIGTSSSVENNVSIGLFSAAPTTNAEAEKNLVAGFQDNGKAYKNDIKIDISKITGKYYIGIFVVLWGQSSYTHNGEIRKIWVEVL